MVDIITLVANARDLMGRKTDGLRAENFVPAVMYGFETDPVNIKLSRGDFGRAYEKAGSSSVIQLDIEGTAHPVLIQAIQYDPLTDYVTHVDFRRINMAEKVETSITIVLEGIAPAVKDLNGVLVQNIEEVEVVALPTALVREFTLDLIALATFDDVLRVSDIKVPEGIEILTDPTRTIAIVQEPRVEEEPISVEGEEVDDGSELAEGEEGAAAPDDAENKKEE
ncbi:50S ribosomal protein L25 [Candidatus Uhrbacteria bacterium]|jgi:large subunit ribosomal protein L25|nr:50S ribosomal protein L25 [Candidatus Uhrbacteria bacterium]MBT7717553.1 50S ribosomal protein L25 [Candidatus Uhrbacteria bacterium]